MANSKVYLVADAEDCETATGMLLVEGVRDLHVTLDKFLLWKA